MRLEPSQPKNESDFFQSLRGRTGSYFYYERVEPANESGFPDVYFVTRPNLASIVRPSEGTIELKYDVRREPNITSLLRGNQKTALLDYHAAGGTRRFALCYCNGGIFLWNTKDFRDAVLGMKNNHTAARPWNITGEADYDLTYWLRDELWKE